MAPANALTARQDHGIIQVHVLVVAIEGQIPDQVGQATRHAPILALVVVAMVLPVLPALVVAMVMVLPVLPALVVATLHAPVVAPAVVQVTLHAPVVAPAVVQVTRHAPVAAPAVVQVTLLLAQAQEHVAITVDHHEAAVDRTGVVVTETENEEIVSLVVEPDIDHLDAHLAVLAGIAQVPEQTIIAHRRSALP
jgi:hypothetical protein